MVDRINRYIMECKYLKHLYDLLVTLELIDTLWNVNMYYIEKYMNYQLELIDTLWNVNVFGTQTISSCDSGINRYIMECKCRLDRTITTDWIELIDTLWNVNEEDWKIKSATITRINRYIMECK